MRLAKPLAKGQSLLDLVLAYDSQRSYGPVGVGWDLSAGSIARNRARGIDYSSKDFLITLGSASVDLLNVNGDLYRDKQGDLRIEARYNVSTDSWVAFDCFGTTYKFGSTDSSRLSGAGGTIQWSLDRVEDLRGNYSQLIYQKTSGTLNLSGILFSGNSHSGLQPRNRIDVTYEAEPPEATTTSFASGVASTDSNRVRQITVTANGTIYATYNLKYQSSQETSRSLLVALTRIAGPISSSMTFSYSDQINSDSWLLASVTGPTRTATIFSQCLIGDFDGDGKIDLACALDGSGQWQVGLSKGSSNSGSEIQIKQQFGGFQANVWAGPAVTRQIEVSIPFSSPLGIPDKKENIADVRSTCLAGDFNGDGRTDIACYNSSNGSWNVGLSNGHGFDVAVWQNGPTLAAGAGGVNPLSDRCVVGDFDGNGTTDLACLVSSATDSDQGKWSVALSTGKGWNISTWTGSSPTGSSETVSDACVAADFNGDRKQDIACYSATDQAWHVAISTATSFRSSAWPNGPVITGDFGPAVVPSHCVIGDFNGDGNADIACYEGTSGSDEFNGQWSMGFSTGSGWSTLQRLGQPAFISRKDSANIGNQCITGDFNGDGRTDIACNYGGGAEFVTQFLNQTGGILPIRPVWGQSLSTGTGFASSLFSPNLAVAFTGTAFGLPLDSCVTADFTGDGKSDLLCDNGWQTNQYVMNISDLRPTDVITDVRDPLGLTGHFSYGFSSYETDTNLGFSIPVLKRSSLYDGITTTGSSYTYSGGAYFKAGNQFRGFHQVQIAHDPDPTGRQLLEALWFHQGDGLAPDQGSALEPAGLTVGKLYRRTLQDRQQRPLLNTVIEYDMEPTTVPNDKAPRLVRQTTEISGSAGSVSKRTALSYDEAGNVNEIAAGSGNDHNGVETHERFTYSNYAGAHAFGYLLSDELSDNQFGKVKQLVYSYDTGACDKPSQGAHLFQLTGVNQWINAATSAEQKLSRSPSGNVTCFEDGLGNRTVSVFDAQDEYLSKLINPLNQTVTFTHYGIDSEALGANAGRVSSSTNASGDVTQFVYDAFGRLAGVTNPDSSSMKVSYNDFGDPAKQSILSESSLGLTIKHLVDGYARRYSLVESAPQGKAAGFVASYDQYGQLTRMSAPSIMSTLSDNPGGAAVEYQIDHDELGRVLSLRDSRGAVTTSCYDGLRAARLDADGYGWVDTFNVFGDRVSTEEYSRHFDTCDQVLQFNPPSPTSVQTDRHGDSVATTYRYDALGRLREVARQGKVLTSVDYNGLGQVTLIKNVDRGTCRYSYDRLGRLVRWQPDSSRTIEFGRDALGRITEVFQIDRRGKRRQLESLNYDYGDHAVGRLTRSTAGKIGTNLSYDAMGRVVRQVDTIDRHRFNLELGYDAVGRVNRIQYPDGRIVEYKYDGSMLVAVEGGEQKVVQVVEFNAYLEPTNLLLGNGILESRTYGNADPAANLTNASCQSVPASYLCSISDSRPIADKEVKTLYRYDPGANVTGIDDPRGGDAVFSYDAFDRLTAETRAVSSSVPNALYSYDEMGRRVSVSGQGEYQYGDSGAVAFSAPSAVEDVQITYDDGGRRQTYGKERSEFDALGRLGQVKLPVRTGWSYLFTWPHNTSIRYNYDALGNLISRRVDANHWFGIPFRQRRTYFVSDYAECALAHSRAECRDLVYGPTGVVAGLKSRRQDSGLQPGPATEYYHLDRNETLRSITDQNGTTVASFSYSAFGMPGLADPINNKTARSSGLGDRYYYAGHRWDSDSGLYYFGTRFYDPRIGQFLSPDADTTIASGGINTYTYARSNPNRWVDPDGRQDISGSISFGGFGGPGMSDSGASFGISINIGGSPGGFAGLGGPMFPGGIGPINFGGPGFGHLGMGSAGPATQPFSGSNAPFAQDQIFAEPNPLEVLIPLAGALRAGLAYAGEGLLQLSAEEGVSAGEQALSAAKDETFEFVFRTEHAAPHFEGTELSQSNIEMQIEAELKEQLNVTPNPSVSGSFWGRTNFQGVTIQYRGFGLPENTINIGTYYPVIP
jgi:RHS repeat-associated protein